MCAETRHKVCLYGAGGHGRVVAAQMTAAGLGPVCFADSHKPIGTGVDDVPVMYNDEADFPADLPVLVTLGDNQTRKQALTRLKTRGQPLAQFVCPRAACHGAHTIGAGSMVLSGAVINPGARIGEGCIINSSAVIEHDCTIGSFCHIAPNATLAGGVTLADGVWIGAGAVVIQGVSIAPNTILGAGSVVIRPITESGTYVGAPARRVS